ncbi:response regulator transcription factor [Chryseolinea sp. H1M3-3]|uniref:LuxR C-terminal-related transcriptional regulator n=1 Tax=Chryseolinea sp. H1M3-3 TaxID=3034144 RepID=UPI0023ECF2D5|nr:response regulator transcription factor [Chryseolinea sp. H1M3-3]
MEEQGGKFLLVDDNVVVRTGLKVLLSDLFPRTEIHETPNGDHMHNKLNDHVYRLVIMDVQSINTIHFKQIEYVVNKFPETPVLIFSMCSESIYGKRFLKAGVKGILSKEAPLDELQKAINLVLSNKRYVSDELVKVLVDDVYQDKPSNPFSMLSTREFEIAALLLNGHTVSDISNKLKIQPTTVATHKARVFDKLTIKNLLELKDLATVYNFP